MNLSEIEKELNRLKMRINPSVESDIEKVVLLAEDLLIHARTHKLAQELNKKLAIPTCNMCKNQAVQADLGMRQIERYWYCRTCKQELDSTGNYAVIQINIYNQGI